jgi:hypothetical protein
MQKMLRRRHIPPSGFCFISIAYNASGRAGDIPNLRKLVWLFAVHFALSGSYHNKAYRTHGEGPMLGYNLTKGHSALKHVEFYTKFYTKHRFKHLSKHGEAMSALFSFFLDISHIHVIIPGQLLIVFYSDTLYVPAP